MKKTLVSRPAIKCAASGCANTVERGQEYSFVIVLSKRAGFPTFQCPPDGEIAVGNYDAQHFCCSLTCAVQAAHNCIDEHLVPRHQKTAVTVSTGAVGDPGTLPCEHEGCNNAFFPGGEYAFAVTLATRGDDPRAGSFQCHDIADDGTLDYALDAAFHDCCSVDCAAQAAHNCIDEHLTPAHEMHMQRLAKDDAWHDQLRQALSAYHHQLITEGQVNATKD